MRERGKRVVWECGWEAVERLIEEGSKRERDGRAWVEEVRWKSHA